MSSLSDSASPRYLPLDRNQMRLQPLDVERLIDQQHPARKIWRLVERLERTRLDWEPSVGQLSTLGRATTTHLDVMSLRQGYRPVHLRATHRTHPILQKA